MPRASNNLNVKGDLQQQVMQCITGRGIFDLESKLLDITDIGLFQTLCCKTTDSFAITKR